MQRRTVIKSAVAAATALAVEGCGSNGTTTSSPTAAASNAGQPGGDPGGGGAPAGQQFTAVNLNTDGDSPGGANTADVAVAATAFLATLSPDQKAKVVYEFSNHQARQTWSNYPAFAVARSGMQMSQLSASQQAAVDTMLQTALSQTGATQDSDIRKADDYLHNLGGNGADGFGALSDYYIAVYGTPSATSPFTVQFGGHHLARNLTYNGGKVSQTPQFVGSEPVSFTVNGMVVQPVKAESTTMFAMIDALDADQKSAAQITSGVSDDLHMGPGQDTGDFPASQGIRVSQLNATQRNAVTAAIQAYAGDLAGTAATLLVAKYTSQLDQTRIGWANSTTPTGEHSYIRIDGPSVWIEFINTRSQSTPNIHFHSVYRDKTNDYGSSKPS